MRKSQYAVALSPSDSRCAAWLRELASDGDIV